MNTRNFLGGCLMLAAIVSFSACNKSDKNNGDEGAFGSDYARIEQNFDDAWDIADEGAETGSISTYKTTGGPTPLSGCATVTRDTISVPHVITIDFGTTNCLCNDGRYRRGQVVLTYTGHYKDAGHVHTLSFNNYFVNDNQVTGTKTVTNMGNNSNGQMYFDITVNGAIILANNGGTRSCVATRTRTFTAGANTPAKLDDVYEVTGTTTITRPNNVSFTSTITAPLVKAMNCQWIKAGTVQITGGPNNVTRVLDYGNGSCDNKATVTVNGTTNNITLP